MKLLITLLLVATIFTLKAETFSSKNEMLPPDSTSTIIEKTAALYLIEEGKKAFNLGKTRDALRRFREAYVRDNYSAKAVYWIGESHYKLDNFGYALKYARIAEQLNDEPDGDLLFLMGQAYHREHKLDSAKIKYEQAENVLSNAKKRNYELTRLKAEVDFADSVANHKSVYNKKLFREGINSGYDDYSMVISNDGKEAFFVSRRPNTKGGNVNPDDQRYFEDIYHAKWNEEENDWGDPTNEIPRLNSEG